MTKRIRQSKKTETPGIAKAKAVAGRGRRGSKTKKQIAIALLERPKGASIAEMQRAMGWQAHTIRAALTRLRQQGIEIERDRINGVSRYRVGAGAE